MLDVLGHRNALGFQKRDGALAGLDANGNAIAEILADKGGASVLCQSVISRAVMLTVTAKEARTSESSALAWASVA
ncbi:hypothetical protein ATE48_15800 [Candidatus Viadribacter manganicus]|uniref:Uncharacterized protein n=1 Tax=Candidatus Viadribacter manganicus TaxID=1759059 RepID=A0A1B1AL27_9PROT|nr:hypothetical protein ATE48_15800 [Candidatus Viadribacter manganicus]